MTTETAQSVARDVERIDELIALGVDSPLKLDLLTTIEQAGSGAGQPEGLAAVCGVSQREIIPTLDELVRAGLLERRRFYNITEYASAGADDLRSRVRGLLAEGPTALRRLRRSLLARASKIN